MLAVRSLSFRYKKNLPLVLRGIDFSTDTSSLAIVGPNGAGKSTLISLLAGLLQPEEGRIELSHQELGRQVAVVPQRLAFYQELTVADNLRLFAAAIGMNRVGEAIPEMVERVAEQCRLTKLWHRRASEISGGEQRKLNLAIGLLPRAPILLLDEPTVGVDVDSRQAILRLLVNFQQPGNLLIYASHQLHELEQLCEEIAFLQEGRLVLPPSPIQALIATSNLVVRSPRVDALTAKLDRTFEYEVRSPDLLLFKEIALEDVGSVVDDLAATRIEISSLQYGADSLESLYFSLLDRSA